MVQNTIDELVKDTPFDGILLVKRAEKRTDKRDKTYIDLDLADRTGEINCKFWSGSANPPVPRSGSPIHVKGTVQEFNGRLQIKVDTWRGIAEGEAVEMDRLVPAAPRPAADMRREIEETVDGFRSESLRKLVREMLMMAGDRLDYYPAAQRIHHAERSGLLHHMTDMLRLARALGQVYDWLNMDLLCAGVILHDLGKIREMKSDEMGNVTDYTRDGQLVGHLVRGVADLELAAEKTGVRGETVALLEHMLLSHHGEPEYGSPKPPMFPEAEALHWIDMMDSRLNTMKSIVNRTPEGAFSELASSMDRRIYHPRYTEDAE